MPPEEGFDNDFGMYSYNPKPFESLQMQVFRMSTTIVDTPTGATSTFEHTHAVVLN